MLRLQAHLRYNEYMNNSLFFFTVFYYFYFSLPLGEKKKHLKTQ